jgi:hypothetical protein
VDFVLLYQFCSSQVAAQASNHPKQHLVLIEGNFSFGRNLSKLQKEKKKCLAM